jgi:hypothetical protein
MISGPFSLGVADFAAQSSSEKADRHARGGIIAEEQKLVTI